MLDKFRNLRIHYLWVLLILLIYFTAVLNLPIFYHLKRIFSTFSQIHYGFVLTLPFVVMSGLAIVFSLLFVKRVGKFLISVLLLLGSILCYAQLTYGIIIDKEMIRNFAQTNTTEAFSYINTASVLWVLLTGIVPILLLWCVKIKWPRSCLRSLLQRLGIIVGSLALLLGIASLFYKDYAPVVRNNRSLGDEIVPLSFMLNSYKYVKDTYFPKQQKPFEVVGKDAKVFNPGERPEIMVIALGETARAQNFMENGYARRTTPYTYQEPNRVFFGPVKTCGTATAVSVPCMFSNLGQNAYNPDDAKNRSSLVDVLSYAKYGVRWLDNDGGCKGTCDRQPYKDMPTQADDDLKKQYCGTDGSCYDEILVKQMERELAGMKNQHRIIFLHLQGSHGPTYYRRVPEDKKLFKPSCETSEIQSCSKEELTNAYDNTLAYTDYVLSQVISALKPYQKDHGVGVFYISDHGESLGENGVYLHGLPYAVAPDYQTRVPMMFWLSPSFIDDHKIDMQCLTDKAKNGSFSQDNFFYSLLGVMDVVSDVYRPQEDIFSSCRIGEKERVSLGSQPRQ